MDTTEKPVLLIIGGSSGLGLELAAAWSATHRVIVTGRTDPKSANATFLHLPLTGPRPLGLEVDDLIFHLPRIDICIYAAGANEDGTITDLHDSEILKSVQLNLLAPALLMKHLLLKQGELPGLIVITSTSQWTPRMREPMYTAGKAGLGMLAQSLSIDTRIKKTLLAAPSGMDTRFWEKTSRDTRDMLNPKWVAAEIRSTYETNFRYKFIRILRVPMRTDVVDTRP